jgi:hypothetical protein
MMSLAANRLAQPRVNIVYCDGGLCNRLNALIAALVLRDRFRHEWAASWPRNNWCGAALERLFTLDMPVFPHSLQHYKQFQNDFLFLMHESQGDFRANRIVHHHAVPGMDAYEALLSAATPVFYYHNRVPPCIDLLQIRQALQHLKVKPSILEHARDFCRSNAIDETVIGVHIRKTDFGNASNDAELFKSISASPRRFFVCSDDREVNERFGALPNCRVFEKKSFPRKMLIDGDWNAATTDSEGRRFPYNITRPADSVVEALVDLLILSVTTQVRSSASTFLDMAMIFKATAFFSP